MRRAILGVSLTPYALPVPLATIADDVSSFFRKHGMVFHHLWLNLVAFPDPPEVVTSDGDPLVFDDYERRIELTAWQKALCATGAESLVLGLIHSDGCRFVARRVGSAYPFQLVSGNHEEDGPDGDIDRFVRCALARSRSAPRRRSARL
mgnify:CR=1 FL=1